MNRLFVGFKPSGISSNHFLSKLKRKYKVKKAGFSGTLDPFASGVLIIAFYQYTKLFRYLKKTPKTYEATLWIGAKSETLDIESISKVEDIEPFNADIFDRILNSLKGDVEFIPPKYSAKKVNGQRAYKLARQNKEFELKTQTMHVYNIKILNYSHPFLSFRVSVSEGGYIRSLGEIISKKLGVEGCLSSLKRVKEGEFCYEKEKKLNPLNYLDLPQNEYLGDMQDIILGKKLNARDFKIRQNSTYFVKSNEEFAIIKIQDDSVKYELNKVKLC